VNQKRDFSTKHPQVKFYLIGTFSGLNLQVLNFAKLFWFGCE